MPYTKNPPKRWSARDEVRALARQYTVYAMYRLIELMDSPSHFVSVNAARNHDAEGLARSYDLLVQACVECHSRQATRRFPQLAGR